MNYQELMQPIDFSALFQLAFTLYAAFIAVEYTKSFTAKVIKHFYNFQGEIESKITEIKKHCRYNEMLSIESDDYYKKGEGLCLVEDYKKKFKECEDKATETNKDLNNYVEKNTEYRIFRHISVFMMLFSFTLLMVSGIYRVYPSQTIHFSMTFLAFSLIFVIIGWICAISRATQTWTERCSFIVVGFYYLASLVLSFFALRMQLPWTDYTKKFHWTIGVLLAAVLPFFNFLFFFILVTIQMNKIRKHCEQSYKPLSQQCSEAGVLMEKILNHQEMKNKIDENKENLDGKQPEETSD